MKAKIEVELDNSAFEGDWTHEELARILSGLAEELQASGLRDRKLCDINGNTVGWLRIVKK